jgi:ATP-dependent DNA helicase RecQ
VAGWLNRNGIPACAYYSDVEAEGFENSDTYRRHLETLLLNNEIKALVATSALGARLDHHLLSTSGARVISSAAAEV